MNGTISNLVRKQDSRKDRGGYGFIRDEAGEDRFFHARDLINEDGEVASGQFETLKPGQRVTFEPGAAMPGKGGGNGLRAVKVRVIA